MDDRALIRAFCDGSEQAFAELVHRHAGLVWSAARRRLGGNEALAEDVVQKTFVLLARKAGSLKNGVSVSGWLYTTTVNLAREALRSEHRRRARESEAMRMNSAESESAEPRWNELAPQLEEAMLDLSEKDQAVILMRYFERKPYGEVASALGGSEEALKMRASRALEKLRAALLRRGVPISAGALGAMLAESAVGVPPETVCKAAAASAKNATELGPLAAKWILMTTAQKTALATGILLLGLLVAKRASGPERAPGPVSASDSPPAMTTAIENSEIIRNSVAKLHVSDARLERLRANLRAVIAEDWPERRLPTARLREALADFGTERGSGALPVILEFLNAPRAERKLTSFASAAYCLELLGADSSDAIPDVMRLLKAGDLALLNDVMPRFFSALSPDGALTADLIEVLKEPPRGVDWVSQSIVSLLQRNPSKLAEGRARLQEMLNSDAYGVRFYAATTLAHLPGEKVAESLPVLLEALGSAPMPAKVIELENGLAMRTDPSSDDERRRQALQAIGELGSAAASAAPALLDIAEKHPANSEFQLREHALWALGKIDPGWREQSEEIDGELRRQEREKELLKKAMEGTATFEENLEALRSENTAGFAALDLARFPEARGAIPALLKSIDRFENSEAVDLLKVIAPDALLERVTERKLEGISDVAQALGELGPAMKSAAPALRAILDDTRPEDSARVLSIAEALRKIDSSQPKLVYSFEDLHEPVSAFIRAVNEKGKIRSPAYNAYIQDFQDHNTVSRGHLLRFVASTKADPELHAIFTHELLKKHPELRPDLP